MKFLQSIGQLSRLAVSCTAKSTSTIRCLTNSNKLSIKNQATCSNNNALNDHLCRLIIRNLSNSAPLSLPKRPTHRLSTIVNKIRHGAGNEQLAVSQGTLGDSSLWVSVDTSNVDSYMPTPETMKEKFYGIPFEKIPICHIKATRNNTLMLITDADYNILTYTTSKSEGFKNAKKKTTLAGQATGIGMAQKMLRRGIKTVRVKVKGLGPGRMASVKGMASSGINIVSLTDWTKIPEKGPRPKKRRRI